MAEEAAAPRDTPLKRLSDGFLPRPVRDALFNTVFFRVGPTDINGWSLVHAATGAAAFRLGIGFWRWQQWHAAWEGIIQTAAGDNRPTTETAIDVVADTAFATAGWLLGRRYYAGATLFP